MNRELVFKAVLLIFTAPGVWAAEGVSCPAGTVVHEELADFGAQQWCVNVGRDGSQYKNGPWVYRRAEGKPLIEGAYKNDLKHGKWMTWDEAGRLITETLFNDDLRDGTETTWFSSGNKRQEGKFSHGVKEGTWITWYPDGTQEKKEIYREGKLQGPVQFRHPGEKELEQRELENGQLKTLTLFHDNSAKRSLEQYSLVKPGYLWTEWFENGKKKVQGQYDGIGPSGQWQQWNSNGELVRTTQFSNGKAVNSERPTLGITASKSASQVSPLDETELMLAPPPSVRIRSATTAQPTRSDYVPGMITGAASVASGILYNIGHHERQYPGWVGIGIGAFTAAYMYVGSSSGSSATLSAISRDLDLLPTETRSDRLQKERLALESLRSAARIDTAAKFLLPLVNMAANAWIVTSAAGKCSACVGVGAVAMAVSTLPLFYKSPLERLRDGTDSDQESLRKLPSISAYLIPSSESSVLPLVGMTWTY